MNALVVYYSRFGNTKRVAEAIAETMRSAGFVRMVSADTLTSADFDGIDLLVAGAPTHVGNLPKDLRPVLEVLPKRALKGVATAAFDTCYKMNWFPSMFTAAKPLARKLRGMGGRRVVPPGSFLVASKEGPLCDGEIERAQAWAQAILGRMEAPA